MNHICRNYRFEGAASLAKRLEEIVKTNPAFVRLLRSNPIFRGLLEEKGDRP